MKPTQGILYHRLTSDEENSTSSLDKERISLDSQETEAAYGFAHRGWTYVAFIQRQSRSTYVVLLASLVGLILGFLAAFQLLRPPVLEVCLAQTSIYSPAFGAVELYDTDLANAFDQRSPYRGPPTPELENAWYKLWNQAEILVPQEGMASLNRSGDLLDEYMVAPPDEGDGYVAGLEVFHQLHCLNYIRQYTWFLMDKYTDETIPHDFTTSKKNIRIHADHCIETLRLALMCHGDVTPVLVKMDSYYDPPRPQAEFSAHHRCRNFDKIAAWNEDHGLSVFGNDKSPLPHHHEHDG